MKIAKPHFLSLGITIPVVIAIGLVSYRDWQVSDDLARSADHARAVSDQTSALLSHVKDAETGQRGYLLTGDAEYLAPYGKALPVIAADLKQLQNLAAGQESAPTVNQLSQLVDQKLSELASTVALRQNGELTAALTMVRTNLGKATMDRIRATAEELIRQQNQDLESRLAGARVQAMQTRFVVLGGIAVLALLLIGATLHVNHLIASLERARLDEQRQKATLWTTLDSIGDAVISTDNAGNVVFLNPVAERITGWPADVAIGHPLGKIFRIVNEETRQAVENPADKVLREGSVVGLANHTLLINRSGEEIPVDDSAAPFGARTAASPAWWRFYPRCFRRAARRSAKLPNRRGATGFYPTATPSRCGFTTVPPGSFLAVNDAAVENIATAAKLLGMTVDAIGQTTKLRRPRNPSPAGGTWRHGRKWSVFWVQLTGHPLEFDAHDAALVLANDVAERKRLEEQFHQAQKLESVGRLAGSVAGDFINLLTVINGYTEMLLSDMPPGSPFRDPLTEIRAAGERASALTQQLLAFSRRQIVKPTVVNPNTVVSDIRRMLRRLIPENIELVSNLSPDLGNVMVDAGHLQQVIMNLAVNGRDAMPRGGKLVMETANVDFDESYVTSHADTRPGPHVMLAVSDTGIGMTPEVKKRLFEPFFTTKPTGSGTGLGLATVFGMVKQAGGWIWVYSEPGQGSTFKIYFPRTDAPAAAAETDSKAIASGSETILIVEDQTEVRNFVVSALEHRGYHVYSAADGGGALVFSREFRRAHSLAAHRRDHAGNYRARGGRQAPARTARNAGVVHVGLYRGRHRPPWRAGGRHQLPAETFHARSAGRQGAGGAAATREAGGRNRVTKRT